MLRDSLNDVVDQIAVLVRLSKPIYNQTTSWALSPIGKHIRHIVDHFWAFQSGVEAGVVDYNLRHRDTELEQNDQLALEALEVFKRWLISSELPNKPLQVISEISTKQKENITLSSTLDREMLYVLNHALHHLAYANLLARVQGVQTPDYIGLAPATASFLREEEAVCAP